MKDFNKGDVLWGEKRKFKEARHPIVYIGGSCEAPLAVILTHKDDHPCNVPLLDSYDDEPSYFVAHLIEKMAEWGPYKKDDKFKLSRKDLDLIEFHISNFTPITWAQYEKYTKNTCPDHKK